MKVLLRAVLLVCGLSTVGLGGALDYRPGGEAPIYSSLQAAKVDTLPWDTALDKPAESAKIPWRKVRWAGSLICLVTALWRHGRVKYI